jgi:hypothetical protein
MLTDIVWASSFIHSIIENKDIQIKRFHREDEQGALRVLLHESNFLMYRGERYSLPLSNNQSFTFLTSGSTPSAMFCLLQTRIKKQLTSITGLSSEQRTYHHFLLEYFGQHFTENVWNSYVFRRWGMAYHELSSHLGRWIHTPQSNSNFQFAGNQNFPTAVIQEINIADTVKVIIDGNQYETKRLWIDATIHQICSLIPGLPSDIEFDLSYLKYLDQVCIRVEGEVTETLQVLDDGPIFAVLPQTQGGIALLSNDRDFDRELLYKCLNNIGLTPIGDCFVIDNFAPIWGLGDYTRYLRVLEFLLRLNIYPVGLGAFVPCSTSTHQKYIRLMREQDVPTSDIHRQLFDQFNQKVPLRRLFLQ